MTDSFADRAAYWDNPGKVKMVENFVTELHRHVNIQTHWKGLEIGAGTGLAGLMLLPLLTSLVLEDTSESMLNMLRKKTDEMSNIEIVHGEITDYRKQDIDLVFSNMAFHHIDDIPGTLKHLHNITTPGAIIVIGDLCTEDGSFHRFQPIPHKGFDTSELSEQFEQAGFAVQKVKTYHVLKQEKIPGTISEYKQFILIAQRSA